MERAPGGTSVGVDDPYAHVDRCDHLTDAGRCRWAREQGHHDPAFADDRSAEGFRCPVAVPADGDPGAGRAIEGADGSTPRGDGTDLPGEWAWRDCPHFRCRSHDRACARCGLEERRLAHDDERPLLEEHHLSYADGGCEDGGTEGGDAAGAGSGADSGASGGGGTPDHEITVYLCRWCHATVHESWGRIDDDANPDPEAIAQREGRRSREAEELGFRSAAERFGDDREG